jgi:MoCo/4Fe-4S cofactor protein with predicted Tat translocation signal
MSSIKPHGKGKTYWRSLDQVAQTPQFKEFLDKEFPAHASEWMGASRRGFMKIMAASFALAGLTSCRRWPVEKVAEYAHRPVNRSPGVPVHYATSMEIAGVGQGLVITSYDGRPIKVEGNPSHPLSLGATDLFAQASVLNVYDPDRARGVTQKGVASNWAKFSAELKIADDGAGLFILSEASGSPSVADMKQRLLEKRPKAQWFEYEAVSNDASRQGTIVAFGKPYRVVPQLDKAAVIVSIDADLFNSDPMGVKNSRDFANGRRLFMAEAEEGKKAQVPPMSRFYSVESVFTTTGACADHRLPVKPSAVPAVLYAIALELDLAAVKLPAKTVGTVLGDRGTKFVKAVAKDLKDNAGRSVLVAGSRQPAEVHALVALLNAALENSGKTVTYYADPNADRPTHVEALTKLVSAMNGGAVKQLVILGGNPVFDAPADLKFADALAKVPSSIHLGQHEDETSAACSWHLAQTHYLEAWGDTQTFDGTIAIVQPLIEPMFDSRSTIEVLSLLAGEPDAKGYDIVRRTLKDAGGLKTEWTWKQTLYEGVIKGSTWQGAAPVVAADLAGVIGDFSKLADKAAASTGVEAVFYASPSVYDGRFANNGWLQELPDPMTRITWDNAAIISPKTAKDLGLESDDVVAVSIGTAKVELSVFILAGQPENTVALALGYGHTHLGQIANGVGHNTYELRTTAAMNWAPAQIAKTGAKSELATVQSHHIIDTVGKNAYKQRVDEDIIKERTYAEFANPKETEPKTVALSLFDEHKFDGRVDGRDPKDVNYNSLHKWGMSIDLTACTGCSACVVACQAENNIPIVGKEQVLHGREMHWLRVDRYFKAPGEKLIDDVDAGEIEGTQQVVLCMHCETAPCEEVCPVGATTHSQEGLNMMTYNRCIGTRYCSNNCPYKVRRFNFFDYNNGDTKNLYTPNLLRPELNELQKMQKNPEVTVRMRGVMEKCTYCVQRIEGTRIIAKREGDRAIADGEIKTACQQVCPTEAIIFGDLNDPKSKVSKLHAQTRTYGLLDDTLNTKPRTRYLEKIRNSNESLV